MGAGVIGGAGRGVVGYWGYCYGGRGYWGCWYGVGVIGGVGRGAGVGD